MNRREFSKTVSLATIGLGLTAFKSVGIYPIDELLGRVQPQLCGVANLRNPANEAFEEMQWDAKQVGLHIHAESSYRSYQRQEQIWNGKYERFTGQGLTPTQAIDKIIEYSTVPGTSRHHWGTDLDIIDKNVHTPEDPLLASHFEKGGCYEPLKKWLDANKEKYGFFEVYTNTPGRKGFNYEPWHLSYKALSQPMLSEFRKIDLKSMLQKIKLQGSEHFGDDFIERYLQDNVLDINPELL